MSFQVKVLGAVAALGLALAVTFGVSIYRELHPPPLPGPINQISERSKEELAALLEQTPHVVGGWVQKRNFGKTEFAIVHYYSKHPIIDQLVSDNYRLQTGGKGFSSIEITNNPKNALHNTTETIKGTARCVLVTDSIISYFTPTLPQHTKYLCAATLPPFQVGPQVNLAIVVYTDTTVSPQDMEKIQKMVLQLQIDIYNRDYKGQETWTIQ